MLDHHALDGVDARQAVTRDLGGSGEQPVPHRLQLEQHDLEPQLVRLVHHDEQQLVVRRRLGQQRLEREQLGHAQV